MKDVVIDVKNGKPQSVQNRAGKVKNSSDVRQTKDVGDLFELAVLLEQSHKNQFAIGDQLIYLIKKTEWNITELAKHFKYARSRLSEFYHTAEAFPLEKRKFDIPFARYELARKMANQFKSWDQFSALAEIHTLDKTQRRDVTRHFGDIERKKNARIAVLHSKSLLNSSSLINNCHNEDCRTIAEKLPDKSIKILFFDPPYGKYAKYKDGKHTEGGAALYGFDSGTTKESLLLTEDMFRINTTKMAAGGVMLLCRPGGCIDPLHSNIIEFASKYGWVAYKELTWFKGKAKLGNGNEPYTCDTERIWVLHRKDDVIINHDNSPRSTVLIFDPVRQQAETADESHLFEKPVDLCRFLTDKHSYKGELVFDACGCSGNFCVAGIQGKRNWVYSETNKTNFNLGKNNILQALHSMKKRSEIAA